MERESHVEVEDSPSIEYILRPITYISWLMGVGVARPRKCPKAITIFIRIVHLAVCSISAMYCVLDFFSFNSIFAFKTNVYKLMHCTNRVISYVAAYYYVCHGIRQHNKWPELMDRMKNLDQKIRRETSINVLPIKNAQVLAILATFACCPLSLIAHVLYYYFTNPEYIFISDLLFYFILAQSLINSFVFDIVVYVLYCRFQTINKLIGQMDELFGAQQIALKIRRIRGLHNGISDLVVMINDIHGLHLLLLSTNCFAVVVATLFRIYIGITEKNYTLIAVLNGCWILYVTQFGLICWICTLSRQESERTGIIIYGFVLNCKNLDQDAGVRNEINDFSIQLQQYQAAFTACNFFEMNNALFSGLVGVISAYLVILIQFYKPSDSN
ncbi:gustatory receptor 23a [Solenopsis invicta]|uniref:gustatory receptor 23a n=1 Tax=Solenopsis invicta TaxID=13686 RepID=UPI00193CB3B0|nr:gustatory receptor 23a [Solenopsis invicta]